MIDFAGIKRRAGFLPFARRLQLNGGYAACPFHHGDSDKTFHIMAKDDGSVIGTCFSLCSQRGTRQKTWDVIAFVQDFDKVSIFEAIRRINVEVRTSAKDDIALQRKKPAVPMTAEDWNLRGRAVTDADVATLSASRPHSATPTAETLNALGFKIMLSGFLACAYRLGDKFYTVKGRRLTTKDFLQENAVSQRGLFNIDAVMNGCDVFVVESELDVAILYEHGHIGVSVISASQKDIEPEVLERLKTARRIYLVGDNDAAGIQCMDSIAKILPHDKVCRMPLTDEKDVGELTADAWEKVFGVTEAAKS